MQLLAAMNPELAPLLNLMMAQESSSIEEKPKRKATAYNKRYGRAYRRIKKQKTLKSGKMAKGFGGKRGHKKIMDLAHKEARKGGKK
jgi:hypothetical protein